MSDTKKYEPKSLSSELKLKYDPALMHPGPCRFEGKKYDTSNMSLKTADELMKKGFPYLQLKATAAKSDVVDKSKKI